MGRGFEPHLIEIMVSSSAGRAITKLIINLVCSLISQDGEVVSRQAHTLKNGSSNLPPATNNFTIKMFFFETIFKPPM